MSVWRSLLIIYPELDAHIRRKRFHHIASKSEIADATRSFKAFPKLVGRLTDGAVRIEARIVTSDEPLKTLSENDRNCFWPSPDDTRRELEKAGSLNSIFVFWPQHNFATNVSVPGGAWGLGMGASDRTNGATYAAVANAPSTAWRREAPGEVWLHEWLHGVCRHFATRGHPMPAKDADGAELHGYVRSPTEGWTSYYRDLMSGNVREGDREVGIPANAWGLV